MRPIETTAVLAAITALSAALLAMTPADAQTNAEGKGTRSDLLMETLPAPTAVSKMPNGQYLMKYVDEKTGVVCYFSTAEHAQPSCVKIAEPEHKP